MRQIWKRLFRCDWRLIKTQFLICEIYLKKEKKRRNILMAIFTRSSQKNLVRIENRNMWQIWSNFFQEKLFSFWYVKPDILRHFFFLQISHNAKGSVWQSWQCDSSKSWIKNITGYDLCCWVTESSVGCLSHSCVSLLTWLDSLSVV